MRKKLAFKYDLQDCPSIEELQKFREGKLPKKLDDDITHHLTFCGVCSSKVTILDPQAPEDGPKSVEIPEAFMGRVQLLSSEQGRERTKARICEFMGRASEETQRYDFAEFPFSLPFRQHPEDPWTPAGLFTADFWTPAGPLTVDFRPQPHGYNITTSGGRGPTGRVYLCVVNKAGDVLLGLWTAPDGFAYLQVSNTLLPAGKYILLVQSEKGRTSAEGTTETPTSERTHSKR